MHRQDWAGLASSTQGRAVTPLREPLNTHLSRPVPTTATSRNTLASIAIRLLTWGKPLAPCLLPDQNASVGSAPLSAPRRTRWAGNASGGIIDDRASKHVGLVPGHGTHHKKTHGAA